MNSDAIDFFHQLLNTPSPTGNEGRIQRIIEARVENYVDSTSTDLHGNLYFSLNTAAKRCIMLAAHCDQIGFIVTEIGAEGYIYTEALGGGDEGVLQGGLVTIYSKNGPVDGVFGRKATHLQTKSEREEVPEMSELWIDIGVKDKKEAEAIVGMGDYATFRLGYSNLKNNRIVSPGLDDKAGLLVITEVIRRCSQQKLSVGICAVSTVQEEVGLRGAETAAFSVQPEVGIAVDVTNASDDPDAKKGMTSCILGNGPAIPIGPGTNPVVGKMLIECAKRNDIPYQLAPSGELAGNDAKSIQVARGGGVAAVGIGIPNRNMHTQVEVCCLDDLEFTTKLIVEFLLSIQEDTDFRPMHFQG